MSRRRAKPLTPDEIAAGVCTSEESSCDPDMRFDQQMTPYEASGYVTRDGVRLLPELV